MMASAGLKEFLNVGICSLGRIKDWCLCSVATSPLALRWMCDSPRTGCARRTTPIYIWHEQAIIEWSWRVISGDTNHVNDWTWQLAYAKSDRGVWSLLLLAATVWSFAHLPLGLSVRNSRWCVCFCPFYFMRHSILPILCLFQLA